jgi:CheY-like chemotaxis protein
VDDVSDTADVLQAVLEPRGVTVNRVSPRGRSEASTVANRPAVVVYAAESLTNGTPPADGRWHGVPQIIIGTMRIAHSADSAFTGGHDLAASDSERRYLQKPFHYAELVQVIEALIAARH